MSYNPITVKDMKESTEDLRESGWLDKPLHEKNVSEIIGAEGDYTLVGDTKEIVRLNLKQWMIAVIKELKEYMGYTKLLPSIPFSIKYAEEQIEKGFKPKEMFEHQIIVNQGIIDFLIDSFEITEKDLK